MTYQFAKSLVCCGQRSGKFSGINQPSAGARFEQKLPVGKSLFSFIHRAPNESKVTICSGNYWQRVSLRQPMTSIRSASWTATSFGSDFVKINPNSKDSSLAGSVNKPIPVFGQPISALSGKFGKLIPSDLAGRTEVLCAALLADGSGALLGRRIRSFSLTMLRKARISYQPLYDGSQASA